MIMMALTSPPTRKSSAVGLVRNAIQLLVLSRTLKLLVFSP